VLGVSRGDSVNSTSSTTTTIPRLESFCTVALYGYLTVRVTDENGKPIQNALVLMNGTLTCNNQTGTVDRSGLTDSDGYVWFDAYPTRYNISVILPETLQGRTILVTQTTFPVGTFQTTLHIACTPSANQCTIPAKSRNSISLQGVSLYRSTPGTYPSPYLSAMIFTNASAPLSSLHLFINDTDEGTTTYSNNTMTNYAIWFKAMPSNPAMPIIPGKIYNITFVATFQDNSTFTASVSVVTAGAGTQTTSITTAPVPFLDFTAILIAILLGLSIVARKRQSKGAHEGPGRGAHSHEYSVIFNSTLASCMGGILEILPAWMTGGPSGSCRLSRRVSSFV
jgi:hypothetical protein